MKDNKSISTLKKIVKPKYSVNIYLRFKAKTELWFMSILIIIRYYAKSFSIKLNTNKYFILAPATIYRSLFIKILLYLKN